MTPPKIPSVSVLLLSSLFLVHCGKDPIVHHAGSDETRPFLQEIIVAADQDWTPSGLTLLPGQCVGLRASGQVEIDDLWRGVNDEYDFRVGPQGTYILNDDALSGEFPMPAGYHGPVPAYALMGKLGPQGKPFYVGNQLSLGCLGSLAIKEKAELYLGINDYEFKDNSGEFKVQVFEGAITPPLPVEEESQSERPKKPRVFTVYVDGLRPDVLLEMTANGLLPNFKKIFFDRGIFYDQAFTIFPSDTITSNSSWITGLFTDKTAVKSQSEFDRQKRTITTYLEKYTPTLAANLMRPVDEYKVGKTIAWLWTSLFGPRKTATRLRAELNTGVDALYDYSKKWDIDFRATTYPIMDPHPPKKWLNLFANNVEWPISSIEGIKAFDRTNAEYTYRYLIDHESEIIINWFPGVDVASHFSARGQFGSARQYVFELDRHLGRIVEKMKRRKTYDDTYFFLFADHGHIGGKDFVNQRFNLPYDLFFLPPRDDNSDGVIDDGSGFGMNIRKYEYVRNHSVHDEKDYAVFDIGSYGTGKVFLPFGEYTSKNFLQRNGYRQLTNYRVSPDFKPVNIIERILQQKPQNPNLYPGIVSDVPVAFVLVPVTGDIAAPASGAHEDPVDRLVLFSPDGAQALIEHRGVDGKEEYRYLPIAGFSQDEAGKLSYSEKGVKKDPLGYLEEINPKKAGFSGSVQAFLSTWHSGRDWLRATHEAQYPNAPVFYFKYFHWHPIREKWRERKTPDLLFAVKPGWNIQSEDVYSTDHGYPQRDSMRIPVLVSGPGTKKGMIYSEPVLITDILPTILKIMKPEEMAKGALFDAEFMDGQVLPGLFEEDEVQERFFLRPQQLERGGASGNYEFLGAEANLHWHELNHQLPPEPFKTYFQAHDLSRYTDLHNIFVDIVAIAAYEATHGIDVVFDLAAPGPDIRPLTTATEGFLKFWDRLPDSYLKRRTGDLFSAIAIREINSLDIYSLTSMALGDSLLPFPVGLEFGERYVDILSFLEQINLDISGAVSKPFGKKDLLGMRFFNLGIDLVKEPVSFALRMGKKYGFKWSDRGLLKLEEGISHLVNDEDDRAISLKQYPGHVGCSCNLFIVDMDGLKIQKTEDQLAPGQGGKGLKLPAPSGGF